MARLLELSLTMVRTSESLREQQRLMVHVSDIQRAISRRDPLQNVLEMITSAAADLLGDEIVGLWVRDPDAPDRVRLLSALGLPATQLPALPLTEVGAVGTAMRIDDVATAAGYDGTSGMIQELTAGRLRASMAAPVRESGEVVGGLLVASYSDNRVYSAHDRRTLGAFAENVSLALTDAHTLDRVNRAAHDTLTGLASRGLFLDRLGGHLAQGRPAALLFIDLDGFKPVNDELGHAAGDELLVSVATRITSLLRAPDVAGRLGGDEFAVMLAGAATLEDAAAVAERLVCEIGRPVVAGGRAVSVGASIGIALAAGTTDPADLLHRADIAMYHAKRSGRGRYVLFDPGMSTGANPLTC
jgi:diguanylate cyclase (GGDEF)-like protein